MMKHLKGFKDLGLIDNIVDFYKTNNSSNKWEILKDKIDSAVRLGVDRNKIINSIKPMAIQDFSKWASAIMMGGGKFKEVIKRQEGYVKLGINREELISPLKPSIIKNIILYIKLFFNHPDSDEKGSLRGAGEMIDELVQMGFPREEIIEATNPVVVELFQNSARPLIRSGHIKTLSEKLIKIVDWIGTPRDLLVDSIEGDIYADMDRFIKKMERGFDLYYLKALQGKKHEYSLIIDDRKKLMELYYGFIIKILPSIRDNKEAFSLLGVGYQDLFDRVLKNGILCDYTQLLIDYPQVKFYGEDAIRAKKLTKGYKILQRRLL